MVISALICEFDPFHNGHKYLLDSMRQSGADCIIACMSGSFTQRGEPAAFDKRTRTEAAILCGADLVIELPVTFACAGAERFAFGGVSILDALGCVDNIFFGSECGDVEKLKKAALALGNNELGNIIKEKLSTGVTFAAAREHAVRELYGQETADLFHSPNNILGIEYLKALYTLESKITPHTIMRTGTGHDSSEVKDNIASGSYLRQLANSGKSFEEYIPAEAFGVFSRELRNFSPCSMDNLERALLFRLRTMTHEQFALLPEVGEGLENRLYCAVRSCNSVEEMLASVKTKRYTMSRLRRIITYALLGITSKDMIPSPPYVRVLGFNSVGRMALSEIKKTCTLPMITKLSELSHFENECMRSFMLESHCDDIHALSGKKVRPCGANETYRIVVL